MNLQNRIDLFVDLGQYLRKNEPEWLSVKKEAAAKNPWFTEEFIDIATNNIIDKFLQKELLEKWAGHYHLDDNIPPKNVGIVMAGNIPMVGFHDFLSVFISGHYQTIKLSGKDDILFTHIIKKLYSFDTEVHHIVSIAENLKGCDAYIATGSNQSAIYFEQYFSRYPHIIRRNRSSVAILTGNESMEDLEKLAEDIHLFFGLGCRNVTKIYVPHEYDFIPLLKSFHRFSYFRDHNKYSNNYDYQLSILLLNKKYYMTNESTLLVEQEGIFSPISLLHYEYYEKTGELLKKLQQNPDIQCIIGGGQTAFGQAQEPGLFTYADGIDTLQFLLSLS
jgi:hypothetical protein